MQNKKQKSRNDIIDKICSCAVNFLVAFAILLLGFGVGVDSTRQIRIETARNANGVPAQNEQVQDEIGQIEALKIVDLQVYESCISYNGLSAEGEQIAKTFVSLIENPKIENTVLHNQERCITIECDFEVDAKTYYGLYAFLSFYVGDHTIWRKAYYHYDDEDYCPYWEKLFYIEANAEVGTSTVFMPVDKLLRLQRERGSYIRQAESALKNIYEGTETDMLLQICEYLKNYTKDFEYTESVNEYWDTGSGSCLAHSFVFRQLAERLGIPCDIIGNATHAWNRITLEDGTYKYYDVSWYVSSGNKMYIDAGSLPHEEVGINLPVDALKKWEGAIE